MAVQSNGGSDSTRRSSVKARLTPARRVAGGDVDALADMIQLATELSSTLVPWQQVLSVLPGPASANRHPCLPPSVLRCSDAQTHLILDGSASLDS